MSNFELIVLIVLIVFTIASLILGAHIVYELIQRLLLKRTPAEKKDGVIFSKGKEKFIGGKKEALKFLKERKKEIGGV